MQLFSTIQEKPSEAKDEGMKDNQKEGQNVTPVENFSDGNLKKTQ